MSASYTKLQRQALLALLAFAHVALSQSCYWRSNDQTTVVSDGWFACNNTQTTADGAQLCCLNGASCGEDSICYTPTSSGGSGWFVGGCTDPTYKDPVCRTSCTGDSQTWIQYNYTQQLWHCCGDAGCTGTPTSETFQGVPPASWSAVPSTAIPFGDAQESGATTSLVTVTATPSSSASSGSSLSTGAIAGIAVLAVLLGIALIAALTFLILWRKKTALHRNAQHDFMRQQQEMQQMQQGKYGGQVSAQGGGQAYQPVMQHHAELEGGHASELEGYERKPGAQASVRS
ncbi:hypothetical protein K431DRAFT_308099 [Polychaeton citri CBS 116435]|uniref:Uncharacterized protein n=1 Tax=Polychaeton citri CBS 116435 TaxID=1314669 RepID=A0A9P4Q0V9_9PEZI|nr:hypothetical protein K431DRAFT_308099 [Polychaeton citri CBS 116435]